MRYFQRLLIFCLTALAAAGCDMLIPDAPDESQILDGPIEGLTTDQQARFLRGDLAFNTEVFTKETGLGPIFVATSCASCHPGDGKGHPFTTLTRFGQKDATGNKYLHLGGPQLQNRALPGFTPEVIPAGATFSRFTPPANTGLGYLMALSDDQILAEADPNDLDGDGISGVPNFIDAPEYYVPSPGNHSHNGKYIGRFGKKAAAVDLMHQTVNAYNQDIGITSGYSNIDPMTGHDTGAEISEQTIQDVVFYLMSLKAPIQRNSTSEAVTVGKGVFQEVGCHRCHKPEWTTPTSTFAFLSNKTFHPYTDLLLHDLGPGLDDGYTEGAALTSEWRTPPLWGLGLSKNAQGGEYFLLHDGRARSIDEAIRLHGGEAATSKEKYTQLTNEKRSALITFLESL